VRYGEVIQHAEIRLMHNCFTEMCSDSEQGSYLRLIDFGITQLLASV